MPNSPQRLGEQDINTRTNLWPINTIEKWSDFPKRGHQIRQVGQQYFVVANPVSGNPILPRWRTFNFPGFYTRVCEQELNHE